MQYVHYYMYYNRWFIDSIRKWKKPIYRLRKCFDNIFKYTFQKIKHNQFLNFKIIQSKYGISIDQLNHTVNNVITPYFKGKDRDKLKYTSDPFPVESSFEIDLFNSTPLSDEENKNFIIKHNGSLAKWVGDLLNLCVGVRIDIHYAVMRMSTYMSHPNEKAYIALDQCMTYLHHHPHLAIMYPRKDFKKDHLHCVFQKGDGEITDIIDIQA